MTSGVLTERGAASEGVAVPGGRVRVAIGGAFTGGPVQLQLSNDNGASWRDWTMPGGRGRFMGPMPAGVTLVASTDGVRGPAAQVRLKVADDAADFSGAVRFSIAAIHQP